MFWKRFKKKDKDVVVIKIGGQVASEDDFLREHINEIVSMKGCADFIIVTGGGGEISQALKERGITPKFIEGQRYTDSQILDIVIRVLSKNNKKIVNLINLKGGNAISLSEIKDNIIKAARFTDEVDLGYVGRVNEVDTSIIKNLLEEGFILVVSPIGKDDQGQTYNINADIFAAQLAQNVGAQKLIYMTSVNGILRNTEDAESTIKDIDIDSLYRLIGEGVVKGGMIPKIQSCLDALRGQVKEIDIVNGKVKGVLKQLVEEGINFTGTKIKGK